MDSKSIPTSAPTNTPSKPIPNGTDNTPNTSSVNRSSKAPLSTSPDAPGGFAFTATHDTHTHGLDLPWVTRDIQNGSSSSSTIPLSTPTSPTQSALSYRVSELNLSAHPSRHAHA